LVNNGRSYRLIGRELGLSKNTVTDIVKRCRAVQLVFMLLCFVAASAWVAAAGQNT
jgi:DNA-binding CsgD family transcriptional regulator